MVVMQRVDHAHIRKRSSYWRISQQFVVILRVSIKGVSPTDFSNWPVVAKLSLTMTVSVRTDFGRHIGNRVFESVVFFRLDLLMEEHSLPSKKSVFSTVDIIVALFCVVIAIVQKRQLSSISQLKSQRRRAHLILLAERSGKQVPIDLCFRNRPYLDLSTPCSTFNRGYSLKQNERRFCTQERDQHR